MSNKKTNKFEIYFLNEDYYDFLKNHLDHLMNNNERPHISYVGFELNGFQYAIPLTHNSSNSFKPSHKYSLFIPKDGNPKNISSSNKLGTLLINKMIPVFEDDQFIEHIDVNKCSPTFLKDIVDELNYLNKREVFNKIYKLAFEARKMTDKDLKFNVDFDTAEKLCYKYLANQCSRELTEKQLDEIEKFNFSKYVDITFLKRITERTVDNKELTNQQKQIVLENFTNEFSEWFWDQTYHLYDLIWNEDKMPKKIYENKNLKKIFYNDPNKRISGVYALGELFLNTDSELVFDVSDDYVGFDEFIDEASNRLDVEGRSLEKFNYDEYKEFKKIESKLNEIEPNDWSKFIVDVNLTQQDYQVMNDFIEKEIRNIKENKNEMKM